MTAVKSLFSISCLFQPEGYCIDTLWVMFSYIEKPFTDVDDADDVVVVCDCDDKNDIIVQQYTTLCFITCSLAGYIYRTPSR